MKADINSVGKLIFIPETGMEQWAITEWMKQNTDTERNVVLLNSKNSTITLTKVQIESY